MHRTSLLLALAASASLAVPAAAQGPEGESLQLRPSTELRGTPMAPERGRGPRLVPLEVSINGARAGNWLLLERDGVLYAPPDAFDEWRLNRDPRAQPVRHGGQAGYALSSLP